MNVFYYMQMTFYYQKMKTTDSFYLTMCVNGVKNRNLLQLRKSLKLFILDKNVVDRAMHEFKIGNSVIKTVDMYRYLAVMLEEFLDYEKIVECLTFGGGRVLGALSPKFKCVKNMGIDTYMEFTKAYVKKAYTIE